MANGSDNPMKTEVHVHEAATEMSRAAIRSETAQAGSMGLSGLWSLVGNASAMVVVAVMLFLVFGQLKDMHKGNVESHEKLNKMTLEHAEKQANLQREADALTNTAQREHNKLQVEYMMKTVMANTEAINNLANATKSLIALREKELKKDD